jgi:hypothetical protein
MNAWFECYAGGSIVEEVPFRNHIQWLQGRDSSRAEAFWKESFEGMDLQRLSIVEAKSNQSSYEAISFTRDLHMDLEALEKLEKKHGVTRPILFRAVLAIALFKYSETNSVVFGSVTSGRESDLEGIEKYLMFM